MHVLRVRGKVHPEKQGELLQTIHALRDDRDKGVAAFTLDQDKATAFSLVEQWETEQDLSDYLGGPKFRVLIGALRILCEESEIECNSQQICRNGNYRTP